MKTLDNAELFQCKFVSNFFEYSSIKKECSSKVFVKAYIFSSLSRRVSSKSFIFESLDIPAAYENLKKEKKISRGKDIYPSYVMKWIGYIYQYFELAIGIPQTTLYKKVKPENLYRLYEAYHSLDAKEVIERLVEANNININLNDKKLMAQLI